MRSRVVLRLVSSCLLALAGAWTQASASASRAPASDAALPFEVEQTEGGVPIFVLGVNRFTLLQLSEFVAGVEPFLARAEGVRRGVQLVWRQEGLRGYVSLSTSPFAEGPAFLLTLRGEPVRTFDDAAAVLGTVERLGGRLLAALTPSPSAGDPGRRPAPRLEFTR